MGSRKIILFGKNSYVISLPKNWIQRNNVKKGDEVNIEETFDMLVISTSNEASEQETKIKKLFSKGDNDDLSKSIISAYINNYDIVEIQGKNLMDSFEFIRNSVQKLVAFEIMELGPKKIIIKDFLNTSDISLDNILRRIDMIIRAMISEAKESMENGEPINLDTRDKDINRLFYVANKLLNKVIAKPKLAKELKIPLKEILFKWRILVAFEEIGDQLKRIMRIFLKISNDKEKKTIIKMFEEISEQYSICVKALYNFDKEAAYDILDNNKKLLLKIDSLLDMLGKSCDNPDHMANIAFIIEKLKRYQGSISNIAKAIIGQDIN